MRGLRKDDGDAQRCGNAFEKTAITARRKETKAQQALTAAIAPLAHAGDGQVAVDDLTTGASAAYGSTQEFVTASIVKVDIVSAAADDGMPFMVKNGWLPSGTTGRWEINSIGDVVHDGRRMLIAALSEGNATEYSGISLVQTVAEAAAGAMAAGKG